MSQILLFLSELFRAHEVEVVQEKDWLVFPKHSIRATGSVIREIKQSAGLTVQIDVSFQLNPDRRIVESFAGLGTTAEKAVQDALKAFVLNDFHVLLKAFFKADDKTEDEQVHQETWVVGAREWLATKGAIGIRGSLPPQDGGVFECLVQFHLR